MAEDKRQRNIKNQATAPLITGLSQPSISQAIEAALKAENARPPIQIRRDGPGHYQLRIQRNIIYSTGGDYGHLTYEEILGIIRHYFASSEERFNVFHRGNDNIFNL
ncbi:hypothetical protein I4U23_003693 [Adineta vaga]|nr:hypothetical protein I4U23_003693 [Adineta vaga]